MPPAPKATEEESVPVKVRVLEAVRVLPSAMVRVEAVAGAVIVTLLTVVAVATPSVGVTNVGEVSKTKLPVPVVPVTEESRLAAVIVETRTLEPSVATRREAVRPESVRLAKVGEEVVARVWFRPSRLAHSLVSTVLAPMVILVAVATPSVGVTRVGLVAKTNAPVPVSLEMEGRSGGDVME